MNTLLAYIFHVYKSCKTCHNLSSHFLPIISFKKKKKKTHFISKSNLQTHVVTFLSDITCLLVIFYTVLLKTIRWTLYNKLEARHWTCSPFIIPVHLPTTVHTVDDKRSDGRHVRTREETKAIVR